MLGQRRRGHLQRGELVGEALDALGLGALVHAVQARHAALLEQAGDGFVGGDHQVLDQAVGLGLRAREDREHVAVLVERELGLLGVDDERAAALALALQRGGGLARGAQRRAPRLGGGLAPGEDAVDLLVVQARVRADHRAVEGGAREHRAVQLHLDGHRHALDSGHQRARVAGERVRQHRLDGARRVHAGGAPARLAIQRRALRHVRGDVGDVHPHADRPRRALPVVAGAAAAAAGAAPAVAVDRLGGDGVVEVACAARVDRERGQLAQVSPLAGGAPDALAGGARFALERGVEAAREAAVEQQRLDHVAGDVRAPELAHDARAGAAR